MVIQDISSDSTQEDLESITIPVSEFPPIHHKHIVALNDLLKQSLVESPIDPDISKAAWKSYSICRKSLVSSAQLVPIGSWHMLWRLLDLPLEQGGSLDRMAHIRCLGEDMESAGVVLNDSEYISYTEAIFISGDRDKAIGQWEAAQKSFKDIRLMSRDYWELGVRMFCQMEKIDQALKAAESLLQTSDDPGAATIIQPIIQACLNSNAEHSLQKAWALYIRLRFLLGTNITMDNFDVVSSALLNANQEELALGVFKDMMLMGSDPSSHQDSVKIYKSVLGLELDLQSLRLEETELRWGDAREMVTLPTKFNNKFFFGSWIKKLIGEGDLESASKVFDLMRQRGMTPDARHLNGLIGSWLRAGTVASQQRAEDIAWKMIETRLEFVRRRETRSELEVPLQAVLSPSKLDYKSVMPRVPRATIETFSILVEHYRRRQKNEKLLDLYDTLRKAQIQPDTFFMNQLLLSDLRGHRKQWAWSTYTSLVRRTGVQPDLDTYICLWQLMKRAKDPVLIRESRRDNFTTCRYLFAEMVQRAASLTGKEPFPRQLYDLIITSFGLSDDQPGTAVALRALQKYFNMYPNEDTVRSIILQLARVGHVNAAGIRPRRLNLNSATKERINQVTKVLQTFKRAREDLLAQQGVMFDELNDQGKLEESILLLSDLLRYVAQSRIIDGTEISHASQLSKIAAEEMAVPDCVVWSS